MSVSHIKCNDCNTFFEHRDLTSCDNIQCPECLSSNITEQLGSIIDNHINIPEKELAFNNK